MSVPLRTILNQAPMPFASFFDLPGAGSRSTSHKPWASNYPEILSPWFHFVDIDGVQDVLGPEDDLDRLLLSKTVYPLNQTTEALQSEADSVRVFYTHIAHPIQIAFQHIIVQRSETGPPGPTSYAQTVDFSWTQDQQCILIGELKRHGIINPSMWRTNTGTTIDNNRKWLGQELRGYCDRYKTTAAVVFDGVYVLFLLFDLSTQDAVQDPHCPVIGFILPYTSTVLRYYLFRVAALQLRRNLAQMAPPVHLNGYYRFFEWWSSTPYWEDSNGRRSQEHPRGYTRYFSMENGAWYWDTPNGRVQDTMACRILYA
ncbi:hypothetical protein F5Y03DRAFT_380578 [Xylaria venustula]|nr:hypothetical protein F5Y03DRAFT_380578 [Xylaria venustula]